MPLFRILTDSGKIWFQEANAQIFAMLNAKIADMPGKVASVDKLDAASARLVPKAMRGRLLTRRDEAALRSLATGQKKARHGKPGGREKRLRRR